jgi:hypothetical protein
VKQGRTAAKKLCMGLHSGLNSPLNLIARILEIPPFVRLLITLFTEGCRRRPRQARREQKPGRPIAPKRKEIFDNSHTLNVVQGRIIVNCTESRI